MRLIVDCDPGADDLVAVAVAHHLGQIVAITTVAGNASLEDTTTNALVAADLVGYDGPVISGAERPRAGRGSAQVSVHGGNGLAGASRPEPRRRAAGTDAAGAIADRAGDGTWIVALGPLTNVAAAFEGDPGLARRVAGVSFMGGAVAMGGVSPVAEFNVWSDPEAAGVVLGSGARLVMCPLDVTTQVRYDAAWIDSLAHPYVGALLRHYLDHHPYGPDGGAPLHDPCAVLAVTHPHLFDFARLPVAVECAGTLTRGMTVVDRRPGADGANVEVAVGVDGEGVKAVVAAAVRAYS